ncbi:MAG: hypothetical protein VCC67_15415 [Myxococcota bacterium]
MSREQRPEVTVDDGVLRVEPRQPLENAPAFGPLPNGFEDAGVLEVHARVEGALGPTSEGFDRLGTSAGRDEFLGQPEAGEGVGRIDGEGCAVLGRCGIVAARCRQRFCLAQMGA